MQDGGWVFRWLGGRVVGLDNQSLSHLSFLVSHFLFLTCQCQKSLS